MLAKKLVFIAAAVALAVTPAVALQKTTHIKIHVNHHKQAADVNVTDSAAWSSSGSGSAELSAGDDEASNEGSLEGSLEGSDEGSDEGSAETGSTDSSADDEGSLSGEAEDAEIVGEDGEGISASALCTAEGGSPVSVEGVEGIFCVTGQACAADIKDGACPGPQEDLEHGAECGVVQSGVYGCKPKAAKHHVRKSSTKKGHSIKVVKAHAHKKSAHKKH